eukprot:Tbor_TRINITY_DN5747_c1_g1::TRINITY_DN5747_c1_g1_i2::g.20140::m.20140
MDIDDEIAPTITKMKELLEEMYTTVIPILSNLNEDILATDCTVEEQAKLSVCSAFVILMGKYSYLKLNNTPIIDAALTERINKIGRYIRTIREYSSSDNNNNNNNNSGRGRKGKKDSDYMS